MLDKEIKKCAFTGHRVLHEKIEIEGVERLLSSFLERGINVFYCGMAKGFDMLIAEQVLQKKRQYKNVRLIACIPYYGQEKNYTEEEKERYVQILKEADEKIYISQAYYKGCTLKRDRFMADEADILVAYLRKKTGGTAYTVQYFQKKYPYKEIVFL